MPIIYQYQSKHGRQLKAKIHISPNEIQISEAFMAPEPFGPLPNFTVTLDEMRALNLDPCSRVAIALAGGQWKLVNVFEATKARKESAFQYAKRNGTHLFMQFLFLDPTKEDFHTAYRRTIFVGEGSSLVVTGLTAEVADYVPGRDLHIHPPFAVIDGPATVPAGGSAEFTVTLRDQHNKVVNADIEVQLRATGGLLETQRLELVNGVGTFLWTAFGMRKNKKATLKAGFELYTKVGEKTVQLT